MRSAQIADVLETTAEIHKLLAGKAPEVQGAILASLHATWIAGHFVAGDPEATQTLRENLLDMHLDGMWPLVLAEAERIGAK